MSGVLEERSAHVALRHRHASATLGVRQGEFMRHELQMLYVMKMDKHNVVVQYQRQQIISINISIVNRSDVVSKQDAARAQSQSHWLHSHPHPSLHHR